MTATLAPILKFPTSVDSARLRGRDTADLRRHCEKRLVDLDAKRQPWLALCERIAVEMLPIKLPFIVQSDPSQRAGEWNQNQVDSTGSVALQAFAASLVSGSMPPNSPWFQLGLGPGEQDQEVREFLEASARIERETLNQSNANAALLGFNSELVAFGTAAALLLPDDQDVIRLVLLSVGEYWIAEDHRERVDTIYRRVTMTVGQLADEFGVDRLSPVSLQAYEQERYDVDVSCIHAIEPDRDGESPAHGWRSVYYEEGSGHDQVLAVRGYAKFPALVTRWNKQAGTAWGLGRGVDALPHLVRLRSQIIAYSEALEHGLDPALQLPAGLQQHEVRRLPGGSTTLKGQQKIEKLYNVDLDLAAMDENIERTRQDVRDTLGSSLIASLRSISHRMTAKEVETRTAQDLMEYLPGIYRLHEELHSPLIELVWDEIDEAGMLPEFPESLQQGSINIEFVSPLARRQRELERDAIVRTFAVAGEIAKVRPDVLDVLDPDRAIRLVGEIDGAPSDILLSIDRVRKIRDARLRQEAAQATANAAQQVADIGATLSSARRSA